MGSIRSTSLVREDTHRFDDLLVLNAIETMQDCEYQYQLCGEP